MRRLLLPLLLLLLCVGCAHEDPYCTASIDLTGRAIAVCRNGREVPVCDEEGQSAHFEDDARGGTVLIGGDRAYCDTEDQVVCANGDAPYCLLDPSF